MQIVNSAARLFDWSISVIVMYVSIAVLFLLAEMLAVIELVDNAKLLGIILQNNFSVEMHATYIFVDMQSEKISA